MRIPAEGGAGEAGRRAGLTAVILGGVHGEASGPAGSATARGRGQGVEKQQWRAQGSTEGRLFLNHG